MILVLSSSLHPESRSRILARGCLARLESLDRSAELFDLATTPLPPCDGATAYGSPEVRSLSGKIESADAILIASPVYNYDVNAALKNAVELTGKSWTGKIVGLMLAAGGQGSYMSAMGLANSLMLDFRCLIVPRFIYAVGEAFVDGEIADPVIRGRIDQLVDDTLTLTDALVTGTTAGDFLGPPAENALTPRR